MIDKISKCELAKEVFDYEDGQLTWKSSPAKHIKVGDIAGTKHRDGYIQIRFKGKSYKAHRLIWILHNDAIPNDLQIDHINGVKDDNHIDNLRLVTPQENMWNLTKAKGYSWNKDVSKFQARIRISGILKALGYFTNEEDARQAYLNAKAKYHIIGGAI